MLTSAPQQIRRVTARTAPVDHRAQRLPIIGEEAHCQAGPTGRDVELLGGRGGAREGALGNEHAIDRLTLARMAGRHVPEVPGTEGAIDHPALICDEVAVFAEARDGENAAVVQAMPILADAITGDAQALAHTDRDPFGPKGLEPLAFGGKVELDTLSVGAMDRKVRVAETPLNNETLAASDSS